MAASAHGRDMIFYTFRENDCGELDKIIETFKDWSIADLYKFVLEIEPAVKDLESQDLKAKKLKPILKNLISSQIK